MSDNRVFLFHYQGDGSRLMRVVIGADNSVSIEERKGCDALGVPRWLDVDIYAETEHGAPIDTAMDWVAMVALAIARGEVTP